MTPTKEMFFTIGAIVALLLIAAQPWIPLDITAKGTIGAIVALLVGYLIPNAKSRELRRKESESKAPPAETAKKIGGVGLVLLVLLTACGGLAAYLAPVVSITSKAMQWVDRIEDFTAPELAQRDEDTRQEVARAFQDVRAAGALIQAAGGGAIDLDEGQTSKAYADFAAAYLRLIALTDRFGVRLGGPDAKLGDAPGQLIVPRLRDLADCLAAERCK